MQNIKKIKQMYNSIGLLLTAFACKLNNITNKSIFSMVAINRIKYYFFPISVLLSV